MQDEISRPVRPHERQREYIATQIVAEYLKSYFGCDAVIYKSSMQRDNAILQPSQIRRYAVLRGYGAEPQAPAHHKHNQE
jgi:hypothetical protein